MRIRPALTLLPAIVLMASGCSDADREPAPLAAQADRVADLLEDDRACEASEALRALDELAAGDPDAEVREAVTTFVDSARSRLGCTSDTPSPTPAPPPPEAEDEAPPVRDEDRDDDEDQGNEGGGNDDEGGGNGNPGRGNGNGNGNGGDGEDRGRGDDGDSDD